MQETLFKQWQDLNQISLDWYRDTSESQTAAINDWMGLQSDPGAWAKFAKSSLESFRSWSDLGESKFSDLWQAQIGKLDLDGVAASIRELGGIQTSACTALAKTQAGILSLYTDTTAQYLESLEAGEGRRGPDRHPGPHRDRRPGQAQELLSGRACRSPDRSRRP